MTFDAEKESQTITKMAADLMKPDADALKPDASCSLMSEWQNLSVGDKNATWAALQKDLPSQTLKENATSGELQPVASDNPQIFGPLVIGHEHTNGDAFSLTFNGKNDSQVTVMDAGDQGPDLKNAIALRSDQQLFPVTWCETGKGGN